MPADPGGGARNHEAEVEAVARLANPAYDAATHDETRAAWRREAARFIAALNAVRRSPQHGQPREPDGYCPACGGEMDHHPTCEVGKLEAELVSLRETNTAIVEANGRLLAERDEARRSPQGEDHEAGIEAATTARLVEQQLPTYGPHRKTVERAVRTIIAAYLDAVREEASDV